MELNLEEAQDQQPPVVLYINSKLNLSLKQRVRHLIDVNIDAREYLHTEKVILWLESQLFPTLYGKWWWKSVNYGSFNNS